MIDTIIELIFFSVFMIFFGLLVVNNIKQRLANKRLRKSVSQGIIDLMAIQSKMEEASHSKKIEETEGFLKFVSDSRDWAFQYIEGVQIAIKNFQDVFHPIAEQYYKDKKVYGLPSAINQEEFGKLFEAYKKLIEELPAEGKKK